MRERGCGFLNKAKLSTHYPGVDVIKTCVANRAPHTPTHDLEPPAPIQLVSEADLNNTVLFGMWSSGWGMEGTGFVVWVLWGAALQDGGHNFLRICVFEFEPTLGKLFGVWRRIVEDSGCRVEGV